MRDVIGKVILNTHLFLSKSEQNKSSKVAVATILNKEATLPILSTKTPHTSLPSKKNKQTNTGNIGRPTGEHRYRGT